MNLADGRIYPTKEMKAIDMAEVVRAAVAEDGVLQGCRFHIDGEKLLMSPGRILIRGRLGVFEPHPEYIDPVSGDTVNPGSLDTENYININLPTPAGWANDAERYICVVYNPSRTPAQGETEDQAKEKMYIELLNNTQIDNMMSPAGSIYDPAKHTGDDDWDANFNTRPYGAILKLGFVKISRVNGQPHSLDNDKAKYPAYAFHTNKAYVEGKVSGVTSTEAKHFNLLKKRDVYLTPNRVDSYMGRHQIAFFRNSTLTVDNVVVNATSALTLTLRREIGSTALLYEKGKTAPSTPANTPYVLLERQPNGTYSVASESPGPDPRKQTPFPTETYEGQTFYTELNTPELHRGIVGIRILNATTEGKGSANCVLQSYWSDIYSGSNWPNLDWRGHIYVSIRNLGSSVARVKLEITSLYVRNSDYNYPAS